MQQTLRGKHGGPVCLANKRSSSEKVRVVDRPAFSACPPVASGSSSSVAGHVRSPVLARLRVPRISVPCVDHL